MRSPSNTKYPWLACFQESWLGFAFSLGSGRMSHVHRVHFSITWLVMEGNTYWTAVVEQAHTSQHQKLRTISSSWPFCGRNSLSTDHCLPGLFSLNKKYQKYSLGKKKSVFKAHFICQGFPIYEEAKALLALGIKTIVGAPGGFRGSGLEPLTWMFSLNLPFAQQAQSVDIPLRGLVSLAWLGSTYKCMRHVRAPRLCLGVALCTHSSDILNLMASVAPLDKAHGWCEILWSHPSSKNRPKGQSVFLGISRA